MSLALRHAIGGHAEHGGRPFASGVVIGIVTNNVDPEGMARVKVKFPWLSDADESFWARIATPMAGAGRGTYFLPEVDDEVLIAFGHGDVRFPYVIGALWNGKDKPPADNSDGENNVRVIRSRSGHVIKLDDTEGKETIEISDASGDNRIVIDAANGRVTISTGGDLELAAPNGAIKLTASTIAVETTKEGTIATGANLDVRTKAELNLAGRMININ